CIKFTNPVSIFQLLPDNIRKGIFLLNGKKILHSDTKDIDYKCNGNGNPGSFKLVMPSNILEIFQSEEADCNIFATVVDTEDVENDIFSCQILWPAIGKESANGHPNLIIHCIQKKIRKHTYKLKIGWIV